jgi:uncharacterized protein
MRRDEAIAKLKQAEPALRQAGVEALYLFGSLARDEARPDSDIDLFIDPEADDRFSFLQYMDAYYAIMNALGTNAEIGYSTRAGLSHYIRAGVDKNTLRIF